MTTMLPGPADEREDTAGTTEVEFADVPAAAPDAELDPYWLQMRAGHDLPHAYMPPAMAGPRGPAVRMVALVLVAVFLTATALGVCLTYGPQSPFR
jgi:hypothetical protein